jgi:hypothetical protein
MVAFSKSIGTDLIRRRTTRQQNCLPVNPTWPHWMPMSNANGPINWRERLIIDRNKSRKVCRPPQGNPHLGQFCHGKVLPIFMSVPCRKRFVEINKWFLLAFLHSSSNKWNSLLEKRKRTMVSFLSCSEIYEAECKNVSDGLVKLFGFLHCQPSLTNKRDPMHNPNLICYFYPWMKVQDSFIHGRNYVCNYGWN